MPSLKSRLGLLPAQELRPATGLPEALFPPQPVTDGPPHRRPLPAHRLSNRQCILHNPDKAVPPTSVVRIHSSHSSSSNKILFSKLGVSSSSSIILINHSSTKTSSNPVHTKAKRITRTTSCHRTVHHIPRTNSSSCCSHHSSHHSSHHNSHHNSHCNSHPFRKTKLVSDSNDSNKHNKNGNKHNSNDDNRSNNDGNKHNNNDDNRSNNDGNRNSNRRH